jgi:5'-methylthioadenosine phosphorylase
LNFRANIYGFKSLGVERILSLSAVGSLKEEHKPLDFVIPDQFVDRTRGRVSTFFGEGLVAHVGFSHPICPQLSKVAIASAQQAAVTAKLGGTYLCMEGPAFSTFAESNLYRSWGMDVIGMTNLQEAKLAREAEICYVTIAMVTDYDCWHPDHEAVTVTDIIANLTKNAENAAKVVANAVRTMPDARECKCGSALAHALITDRKTIPDATRKKLELLVGKYL